MRDFTNSWKASLPLADIDPSRDNPRRDFGDIDALADRIRATGGQPVNPIVVVRDGERYRIVDGERRYRALLEIYGEYGSTTALVFPDYSAAHAAVAMLATDDKRTLTPEEQARGFQTMMRLDVPEDLVVKATGMAPRDVSAARRSMGAAGRVPEGHQVTMEALIAAGSDEFSEDERDKILASNWPGSEAAGIAKGHRQEQKLQALRLALPDCIEFGTKEQARGERKGLLYVAEVRTAKAARELELEDGKDYVALPPRYEESPCWTIYQRVAEGEEAPPDWKVRQAREKEEQDRRSALLRAMRTSMMAWLIANVVEDLPATCDACVKARRAVRAERYELDSQYAEALAQIAWDDPSSVELVGWLDASVGDCMPAEWAPYYHRGEADLVTAWDALVADGWVPAGAIREVRAACKG